MCRHAPFVIPVIQIYRFEEVSADLTFTQRMPRKVLLHTLFCLLVFATGRDARAERIPRAKDLKRAEAVLSKLRRLEEAARSPEPGALRKAASGVYPGILASVSKLQ